MMRNLDQERDRRSDVIPTFVLLIGLLGSLAFSILTPPFQVPDEQQHFYRAYQLSTLDLTGTRMDKRLGAILPSALPETVSMSICFSS